MTRRKLIPIKRWWIAAALAGAFLIGHHKAHSAEFKVEPIPNHPGQVQIYLMGKIEMGDDKKFEKLIESPQVKSKPVLVILSSDGGYMVSGVRIGAMIYDMGYNTSVENNNYCVSMCAEIWLAGRKRYVQPHARIGFHSIYETVAVGKGKRRHTVKRRSESGDALMTKYHIALGLPKATSSWLLSADPDEDVTWLTGDKAVALGIDAIEEHPEKIEEAQQDKSTAPAIVEEVVKSVKNQSRL